MTITKQPNLDMDPILYIKRATEYLEIILIWIPRLYESHPISGTPPYH